MARKAPKYRRVKAKSIEVQRKLAQEPAALLDWYTRLKDLVDERGILPEDIYNMDETGCCIGVAKEQYLYTKNGGTVFIHNANNRELITLVECVRGTGEVIPPLIIVKAATVVEHWIVDLPNGHLVGVSDSGYSNDTLAYAWIQHFNKFCQFAEDNKIQLFALPPHTTHLLPPLDVGCFQPLKWYHGKTLEYAFRTGSRAINKADFMATIEEIRRLTFTKSTICSGWRRTGIMPYKPDIALAHLRTQEGCYSSNSDRPATPPLPLVQRAGTPVDISSPPPLISSPSRAPVRRFHRVKIDLEMAQLVRRPQPQSATPEPEDPKPGDATWHTPKTVRQIELQEPFVRAVIRQHLPRQVAADVIRHLCGVSALARNAEGFKRELHKTEAAIIAKEERRRRKKRIVESKGGVIYAEDARHMVQQRQVNDLARLKVEIATKRLREATIIFNKWRRIFPTIRNFGRKYTKRIAAGITTQRDVTRWQHINADDSNYNIKALRKWELILQNSSSKYREGAITTDRTPAMWVAYNVRQLVDPYTKLTSHHLTTALPSTTLSQDRECFTQYT
ncbi:DDE superfamily endonuclease [Pyrenophora tritici-repentis]|nr:DDE superfamily endonuclease [Pyrenophora tritici-repentis]